MHLSGLLYQTGHMPARAAPSMSQRTSSPINQHFPASIPARESARRKIHSEGLRKAPSLLARMNSKRLEGSVSAMRRRRDAPEYERLLMTAVRMPSCPHSYRKASTPFMGYMGSVALQRRYSSSSRLTSKARPRLSYISASSLKPSVSSS